MYKIKTGARKHPLIQGYVQSTQNCKVKGVPKNRVFTVYNH